MYWKGCIVYRIYRSLISINWCLTSSLKHSDNFHEYVISNSDNWKYKFGPEIVVARSLIYRECLRYLDISEYNQQSSPLNKMKHEIMFFLTFITLNHIVVTEKAYLRHTLSSLKVLEYPVNQKTCVLFINSFISRLPHLQIRILFGEKCSLPLW